MLRRFIQAEDSLDHLHLGKLDSGPKQRREARLISILDNIMALFEPAASTEGTPVGPDTNFDNDPDADELDGYQAQRHLQEHDLGMCATRRGSNIEADEI
ncbi:hypothetical protein A1O3_01531 [Capronia epimyces CBS 606.96]|uniref:Uncharacterized protein n=1 Tax=Capronia epimyces CBS 606.96 TaxID=1182542 RepID=W9YTI8_9EURO|nr:uncharacterized protein A1O3_01531 [Capronia epimyces CBS 606.96]EXJ92975.1 hypothetical protein A1O3_01531 [Capronia epimyces CBS 606.96]